ncbi:MAG: inositol monophosphatase [Flavobacteriales bacterium]|nr:inositol monophosphatase [Flavobacteriales bacterium]
MNNICENFKQIIINSIEDIKNLKNKTIQKSDNSFVSEGDLLVQKLIADEIKKKYNNYYFISEENDHKEKWKKHNDFIVLDPIDGTENFISGMNEWGVGISIFKDKEHAESMIFLPDMNITLKSGDKVSKNKSRIIGMSSRYFKKGLKPCDNNFEYRALGCSMINMYYVITGSFKSYVDTNGGFIWDILPGLNLALENNCEVYVEGEKYNGQFLSPDKRYKLEILNK